MQRVIRRSPSVFVDALYVAFDADQEPTDLTVAEVLVDFVPLSKLMAEQMNGLRHWARGQGEIGNFFAGGEEVEEDWGLN